MNTVPENQFAASVASHSRGASGSGTEVLLRAQLELYDRALNATSTHFAIVACHSPDADEVVYCNRAIAEHYGYLSAEMIGMSFLAAVLHLDAARCREVIATLQGGQEVSMENEVPRKDGSTFWIGITLRPLFGADGQLTHFLSVGADITRRREEARKKQELQERLIAEMKERERMAAELNLAQKLESVGRLAAGLAHEINTPIQYVGDSVYFIRDAYQDIKRYMDASRDFIASLPEELGDANLRATADDIRTTIDYEFLTAECPKAIERIAEGADRVAGIVRAMKEFAHPGGQEHVAADINHALQTTLVVATNEYKYLAAMHTHLGELPLVVCNIGELNQVFLNLVVNAAHAIHDAGRDVSSGEIHVHTEVEGDMAVIRIRDNGCGIPAEHLDKIYDPFFTTKEVGRGTGQGLAITRSIIVDKHGGKVSVNSTVGSGTEFILQIPINGHVAKTGNV
ncbi:MAG TPA: ATP-binding protein [Steroidobacteraceae bacterium]|nr:ATP-binding protein [Steroidobacteraceae bacterium]